MTKWPLNLLQARTWVLGILVVGITPQAALGSPVEVYTTEDAVRHNDSNGSTKSDGEIGAAIDLAEGFPTAEKDSKRIAKRSAHDFGGSFPDAYSNDYLQAIQYNPMMAWGRRRRSDSVSDSLGPGYAPPFSSGAKHPLDSYMETVYYPNHFFHAFKRATMPFGYASKGSPHEMGARGFHENIFTHNFGDFSPVKRRKRDTETLGGSNPLEITSNNHPDEGGYPYGLAKRRFGMDASGFHGDTFSDGWGTFSTMRKRRPEWDSSGFHGDIFSDGFGSFDTMRKRRPEMDAFGFHGDTFSGGFGDFSTMKRRPEMTSSGFHGDMFSNGFGDFYTMKKRGDSGDSDGGLRDRVKRDAVKPKRRPEMTASGFHGDTFSNGFGDFYTMKRDQAKRRPEMTASGFHGDTFSNGFGDFYTMRKRINDLEDKILALRMAEVNSGQPGRELNGNLQQEIQKENGKR